MLLVRAALGFAMDRLVDCFGYSVHYFVAVDDDDVDFDVETDEDDVDFDGVADVVPVAGVVAVVVAAVDFGIFRGLSNEAMYDDLGHNVDISQLNCIGPNCAIVQGNFDNSHEV